MQIYLLQRLSKYNEISVLRVYYGKPSVEDVRPFFKDREEITDEDINGLIGLRYDLPYDLFVYTMIALSLDDDKVRGLLG